MRTMFESETEKSNVMHTLTRLIETMNERSHSTAELMNLNKARACVLSCDVEPSHYSRID